MSLYNESSTGRGVPPSPIVCCLGVLPDASKALGVRLAHAGDRLVLVGRRRDELGGSEAARLLRQSDRGRVPTADFAEERRLARAVLRAVEAGAPHAAHDISTGGLFVAAAEMMLGAWGRVDLGLDLDLSGIEAASDLSLLFSETGAYLVEVEGDGPLPAALLDVPHAVLGRVTDDRRLRMRTKHNALEWSASELEEAWGRSFEKAIE